MMGMFKKLARDRKGSSAMEMALLVPLLAFGLFASFDMARGFSRKIDLVNAAARTLELATVPGMISSNTSALATEAVAAAGQTGATATVATWLECAGVKQEANVTLCGSGVEFARYMSISITAPYQPTFNYGGLFSGSGVSLNGTASVRMQ